MEVNPGRFFFSGEHDLRPGWNYFVGMLIAAYKEFDAEWEKTA